MSIASDIQSLSPTAVIELFELVMTDGNSAFTFHAGTNQLLQNVVWGGVSYVAAPIEAEGFDISSKGVLPRPKIRVANIDGVMSAAVMENDDLVGCKVIRKRTFAKYLDSVNFTGGNPNADPNQHFPDDIWYVERKVSENRYVIEWELSSAFDLIGVMLPYRQVVQNTCSWGYRSAECGYTGTSAFDINDLPTTLGSDVCAKRLSSCKLRFPNGSVPFGGFPGAIRYD